MPFMSGIRRSGQRSRGGVRLSRGRCGRISVGRDTALEGFSEGYLVRLRHAGLRCTPLRVMHTGTLLPGALERDAWCYDRLGRLTLLPRGTRRAIANRNTPPVGLRRAAAPRPARRARVDRRPASAGRLADRRSRTPDRPWLTARAMAAPPSGRRSDTGGSALVCAARHSSELIEMPRRASERAPRHNLPASLTSFIGRERELAEVQARLADVRGC